MLPGLIPCPLLLYPVQLLAHYLAPNFSTISLDMYYILCLLTPTVLLLLLILAEFTHHAYSNTSTFTSVLPSVFTLILNTSTLISVLTPVSTLILYTSTFTSVLTLVSTLILYTSTFTSVLTSVLPTGKYIYSPPHLTLVILYTIMIIT